MHGRAKIFEGLEMILEQKFLKIIYHVNHHQITTNFVSTTFLYDDFFWPHSWLWSSSILATLPALRITFQSCLPRSPPSTTPSAGTLQNLCTCLVLVPALGALLGGECGEQLFNKSVALAENAVKKKIKKFVWQCLLI